jgi:DNA-binding response OmpR family regulator
VEHQLQRHVLIAEDDRAMADIIRLAFRRAGYEVSVCHDGAKALQTARNTKFDFIISDFQMPKLNGHDFLAGVRAEGLSSQAVLVLCSAKTYEIDSEDLRSKLDLAAVFYKPFSLNELVATIHDIHNQTHTTV